MKLSWARGMFIVARLQKTETAIPDAASLSPCKCVHDRVSEVCCKSIPISALCLHMWPCCMKSRKPL